MRQTLRQLPMLAASAAYALSQWLSVISSSINVYQCLSGAAWGDIGRGHQLCPVDPSPQVRQYSKALGMPPETSLTCLGTWVRLRLLKKCRGVSQKCCVALPYWSLDNLGLLFGCSVLGVLPVR